MTKIEVFEQMRDVAKKGWDFALVAVPVVTDDARHGTLDLLQMFDILVRMGDIQDEYTVAVYLEDEDEDYSEEICNLCDIEMVDAVRHM